MDKKYSSLPLRSGVGIVVLNKENKVFVAKRIDNPKDFWQMPQGGVDSGEDFLKAAYRELEEETSIKSVKLIKELDGMITYELPERLLGIIWKGKYRGQKQKWFLMRGMQTKIEAAKICQLAGSSMVIANGLHNNPITKIIEQNNSYYSRLLLL